jgi:YD repeat-containing protein
MSVTDKAQLTTKFGYDGFGRRVSTTDSRGIQSDTHYNDVGQVDYTEDGPGHQTQYTYDEDTGRLKSVENPLGKLTYYAYDSRGALTHAWGDVPQPMFVRYDDYGQCVQLSTFRGTAVDWSEATWPADVDPNDPADADITTWTYDPGTGLLTTKTYADGSSVAYTYKADGRLETREWARLGSDENPRTTTYHYYDDPADPNTFTGELRNIEYSDNPDDTPDVELTYTRGGKLKTVSDAVGSRAFAYEENDKWRTETFDPNSLFGDMQIKHDFDSAVFYAVGPRMVRADFLRLSEIDVGTSADPDAYYAARYDYHADTDRMNKVCGPGLPGGGALYVTGRPKTSRV